MTNEQVVQRAPQQWGPIPYDIPPYFIIGACAAGLVEMSTVGDITMWRKKQ